MTNTLRCTALALALAFTATRAAAQTDEAPRYDPISLSGPRVGATVINQTSQAELEKRLGRDGIHPLLTQMGWQFEQRLYTTPTGLTTLTELVVLVGGMEQSLLLPSASGLIGLRTRSGLELGIGPNVTAAGVSLAATAGVTVRSNAINFPINVAIASSQYGVRTSLLVGFNLRD